MRLKLGAFASSGSIPLSISYSTTNFSRGSNSTVLTPTVTGGTGSKTYSYTGTLPANTSFNTSTGQITGPSALKGYYTPRYFPGFSNGLADNIDGIAVAPDGSIYAVGNTRNDITVNGITYVVQAKGSASPFMGFVTKYNPDGSWAWFRPVQASVGTALLSVSISPSDGSVYVAGYTKSASVSLEGVTYTGVNTDGSDSLFTGKLSSSGVWEWAKLNSSGGTGQDRLQDIKVSSDGLSAYVTGYTNGVTTLQTGISVGNASFQSGFIAKISSSGVWEWAVNSPESATNAFNALQIDSNNNLYVVGTSAISSINQSVLFKYNSSGTQQFRSATSVNNATAGQGIALDSSGNIYITGNTSGGFSGFTNSGGQDIFVIKYNSAGTVLWTQQCGSTGTDQGRSIAVDSSNNVYVVGQINATAGQTFTFAGVTNTLQGSFDAPILKFSSSGTPQWAKLYGTNGIEFFSKIVIDSGDRIHVAGVFGGTNFTWNLGDTTFTVASNYDFAIGMINPSNGNFYGNAQPGFPATLNVSVTESGVTASTSVTLTYG